jgi:BMFP domain-containing protein YqiC
MTNSDDNYTSALLEHMDDQFKAVLDAVAALDQRLRRVEQAVDDLPTRDDVAIIQEVILHQRKELHSYEQRLTRLENKTA